MKNALQLEHDLRNQHAAAVQAKVEAERELTEYDCEQDSRDPVRDM